MTVLPEVPAFDPEALTRLQRFGGAKLLREMISLYMDNAPSRLAAARAALAEGDVASAENALHSLKSSSAQLGAIRLSRLCEQGETIARSGTLDGIAAVLDAGRDELARVARWLTDERVERSA